MDINGMATGIAVMLAVYTGAAFVAGVGITLLFVWVF
jgi:hypothetical protein